MLDSNLFSFAFQDAIDKVSSADDYLFDSFRKSLTTTINSWLLNHPFIYWLVNHPIISIIATLIVTVLIIRLVATIYHAIANTIDRMWLWILQSPFLLLKLLFGWERKPKNIPVNTLITNYEVTNNPEQLQEIMNRLDLIQQQQTQILLDIAQLKQESLTISKSVDGNEQKLITSVKQHLSVTNNQ